MTRERRTHQGKPHSGHSPPPDSTHLCWEVGQRRLRNGRGGVLVGWQAVGCLVVCLVGLGAFVVVAPVQRTAVVVTPVVAEREIAVKTLVVLLVAVV